MKNKTVKIFSSFEEENEAEQKRRRQMTSEERMREFSVLMDRRWGKDWHSKPIKKIVSYEKIEND
ncbi:MAG: hypothetical protein D8M58_19945 [Calditrichaeota bacterium]|nr:MAG: hypothetical protein DWQ03_14690 [Calditrichota bacterium]MBL1207682.1 hypothetical protein [Calditrichota bacterium]NOG47516.1 hypothetical protein [Calditrichota bacterium]